MNRTTRRVSLLAAILLGGTAATQSPSKPPPWWNVPDEVTVSLYFDFDSAAAPFQPTSQVVPSWYSSTVTAFTVPPNVVWIPSLGGQSGCVGLVGTGSPQSAALALKVDNDPHLNWVKIFWFQFDAFEGTSGAVAGRIEQDLAKYGRAIVRETREPLAGGWQRVTIEAQLIPQPDDETIDWSLLENAFGSVAIDNLFVSSKCVKPQPDEKGDALGRPEGQPIDLTALTAGAECLAAAVVEGPPPAFDRRYWISTRAGTAAALHTLVRVDATGPVPIVVGSVALPDTLAAAPSGATDLAVATLPGPVPQQFVYALVDRRPANPVVLRAIDTATSTLAPAQDVVLPAFPPTAVLPPQPFGLAFDPSGAFGNGTFWVSATDTIGNGIALEWSRTGALLDTRPVPSGCAGLGYDATLGDFYGFSRTVRPSPGGPVQTNGVVWSGYDFAPTGVQFCGDLTIPNGAGPRGGLALGLEAYRRSGAVGSQLHLVCVVDVPAQSRQFLYELTGPYGFGWSQLGRCGMRGGPPFLGSGTFGVTLSGVPNALLGMLIVGVSNDNWLGVPLPAPLWPENYLAVSYDLTFGPVAPIAPGSFDVSLPIPPGIVPPYQPVFFQWLLLDTSVPGLIGTSQAGKTVVYP